METMRELLISTPVVPVLEFTGADEAVAVCRVLYESGIKVLEITLRHETALDAIAAVVAALPDDAVVGAGTVTTPEMATQAKSAGAVFGVSPGLTENIALAVNAMNWPFLPGVATLSEALHARELGFTELKFFPAAVAGGPAFLKAVNSVLPGLGFCPTGGISANTMADYLAINNVLTVGGSWLTAREADGSIDLDAVRSRVASLVV